MPKKILLVTSSRARSLIPKLVTEKAVCYYLVNDPKQYLDLQNRLVNVVEIRNLAGLFHEVFEEIKESYCAVISDLNQRYNSVAWWGGQLASKNNAAAPLPLLHIIYLFCAKKIIAQTNNDIDVLLVLNSSALAGCIKREAFSLGVPVHNYRSIPNEWKNILRQWLSYCANTFYFVRLAIQSRIWARLLPPSPPAKVPPSATRVVIRSWITKGVFDKNDNFHDRHFGPLPDWLRERKCEVWTLPMLYNLPEPVRKVYQRMRASRNAFLLSDHFLHVGDYINMLIQHYRLARKRFDTITIKGVEVTALFQEAVHRQEFNYDAMVLNLVYPMVKRLQELRYEIDAFYYPFENNLAEKPFILGVRAFFPQAKIIGFQHAVAFPELLSCHFNQSEKGIHPLPDQIICNGPHSLMLYREAGFPPERLIPGSNLRFGDVFHLVSEKEGSNQWRSRTQQKIVLLPLPYGQHLTFEILTTMKKALGNTGVYKIYIRHHPLLQKKSLLQSLKHIRMEHYEFADQGVLQDWLPRSFAVVSGGWSVTSVEAACMGVPVLRLLPANTFFLDPFADMEYPLQPVATPADLRDQLHRIDSIIEKDPMTFKRIGENFLEAYFTKPDQQNLEVFFK